LLATLLLGACVEQTVDRGDQPIHGGELTADHPAIGYLSAGDGQCTATLIGERTLLTARHCVGEEAAAGQFETDDPATVEFFVTDDATDKGELIGIAASELIALPIEMGTYWPDSDLAIVLLESTPDPAIARIALATAPPVAGEPIVLVGFGWTEHLTVGQKRQAATTIAEVTTTWLRFGGPANIDGGDSGGPSLVTRGDETLLLGVHSHMLLAAEWEDRTGVDMRVDAFLDWIMDSADGDVLVGLDSEP
jgi:V8-like Glu-specific endopeptidase